MLKILQKGNDVATYHTYNSGTFGEHKEGMLLSHFYLHQQKCQRWKIRIFLPFLQENHSFFWRENSNIFYKMFICFFAQKFIQFLARNFKYFTRIFGGKIHTSLSAFQILRFFRFLAQKRIRFLAWKFGTIGRLDFTYGQVIYFSEIS